MEKFGGYKTVTKERIERKENYKKERGMGITFRDLREVKRRDWNENVFVRPNGLR